MSILHFGIRIQEKTSNHINKELYLSAKPEGMRGWTEEHYVKQRAKADLNFDLNMAYFKSLDFNEFNDYLLQQCKKHKFVECRDLNTLDNMIGIYMLVLDSYKQVYIGQSNNIKRRIMSHWNSRESLERLIYCDICSSILPVDSFGALDTTRIFYIETHTPYISEEKIVSLFDSRYLLNRTAGGIGSPETNTDSELMAKLSIIANLKRRNLVDFLDVKKLQSVVSENDFKSYLLKYPELSLKM